MRHRDLQDLIGGVVLAALGVFVALYSHRYDFGTAARMGPGFFPHWLGWILAALGVLIALPAWFRSSPAPLEVQWRNLLFVLGSIVLFAFTLKLIGLVLATFVSAFVGTLAERDFSWRGRVLTSIGVSAVTVAIFIGGLSMVLPVWPWNV
jgi:small-conductance mechanosensitive channel